MHYYDCVITRNRNITVEYEQMTMAGLSRAQEPNKRAGAEKNGGAQVCMRTRTLIIFGRKRVSICRICNKAERELNWFSSFAASSVKNHKVNQIGRASCRERV